MTRISRTSLVAYALLLHACSSGYYSQDTYFGPQSSEGWRVSWSETDRSRFGCRDHSVVYRSFPLSSIKTAEGFFGIPMSSRHDVIATEEPQRPLFIILGYEGVLPRRCGIEDVTIHLAGATLKPFNAALSTAGLTGWNNPHRDYFCHYSFEVAQGTVTEFTIQISPERLGCEVPPLAIKRTSGSMYQGTCGC